MTIESENHDWGTKYTDRHRYFHWEYTHIPIFLWEYTHACLVLPTLAPVQLCITKGVNIIVNLHAIGMFDDGGIFSWILTLQGTILALVYTWYTNTEYNGRKDNISSFIHTIYIPVVLKGRIHNHFLNKKNGKGLTWWV